MTDPIRLAQLLFPHVTQTPEQLLEPVQRQSLAALCGT